MSDMLNILIVEDNPAIYNQLSGCIDSVPNFSLLGIVKRAKDAIEYVKDFLPDVIILELELHQGSGNGFEILKGIRELTLTKTPYILVTTSNTSAYTYEIARELGADFILSKHQENYTEQTVIDFLETLYPIIPNIHTAKTSIPNDLPLPADKRIYQRILSELNLIGINPKSLGYDYLADGIMLVIQGHSKNIFTQIGLSCQKTNSSVERAMQNAIKRAWRTTDINILTKYYTASVHSDRGEPTTMEFLHYYAKKLQNEYL